MFVCLQDLKKFNNDLPVDEQQCRMVEVWGPSTIKGKWQRRPLLHLASPVGFGEWKALDHMNEADARLQAEGYVSRRQGADAPPKRLINYCLLRPYLSARASALQHGKVCTARSNDQYGLPGAAPARASSS